MSYAPDVSPHHEPFQMCGQIPALSVMEEHPRHLNFGLGITSPMSMNNSGTTGGGDTCELNPVVTWTAATDICVLILLI